MLKKLIYIVITLLISLNSFSKVKLKEGVWISSLQLNNSTELPFQMEVIKERSGYKLHIINGSEKVELINMKEINDSISVDFKDFESSLIFTVDTKKCITGYWINYNKSNNYRIPFKSICSKEKRFEELSKQPNDINVTGNWKVVFNYHTDKAYHAIGVFNQKKETGYVDGTFLTETGDYRFLEGQVGNDNFNLSCFDGSHAFLFESQHKQDTLWGTFYSGNHWNTKWYAVRDEDFTLRDSDSITYLKSVDYPFNFSLKDIYGEQFSYPNPDYEDKVIIIQIMGTWCPNCLDETKFYKSLYNKYNKDGLEIISIGYETSTEFEEQASKIERLRNMYDLDFKFLVGGKASKQLASEQFHMLNHIVSFPTSIYINKDGKVVRIHTGFNGPGTGKKYDDYTNETEKLIETLLKE